MANKLTIYLIKQGVSDNQDIVSGYGKHLRLESGDFFTESSSPKTPRWIYDFFLSELSDIDDLMVSSAKGLYITRVVHKKETLTFVLSFGTGRHMIRPNVIVENFGLRVILNSVHHQNVKGIKKHNIATIVKRSDEQMSKGVSTADFGIDIEQDLLTSLKGKSNYEFLGKTISGTDALSVNVDVNVKTLKAFLIKCYTRYQSNEYKKHFDWVDHIAFVRSEEIIRKLDAALVKLLNKGDYSNVCFSVPAVIDEVDVKGYSYIPHARTLEAELDIERLIQAFRGKLTSADQLKARKVKVIGVDDLEKEVWDIYECISAEISIADKQFVIVNGRWYEISNDYVNDVNSYYERIALSTLKLPIFNHKDEGAYNAAVCKSNKDFMLMDRENITYGGGRSKIEFCDLYSKGKEIVHVKRRGGSSVLSHLFNQGAVSGELLISDSEFRSELNKRLTGGFKVPTGKISAAEFKIIFGVISSDKGHRPTLPFFSKITLRNAAKRLGTLGFSVELLKIQEN
ncbi:DUF6119 family protein [Chitinophaga sp. NPDC101104]|uniref:DUF6119 family protein n=1 Tax=Chitinophaga sp. NPDC101104 TaxID=3390561 RepID=UPI003D014C1D